MSAEKAKISSLSASLDLRLVKSPVSPRDCALLIGIPLERESFYRKLEREVDGNFAQAVVGKVRRDLAWTSYQRYARLVNSTASRVELLGVRVARNATLNDLGELARSRALTLVSQWRSALFKPADLLDCGVISKAVREELRLHDVFRMFGATGPEYCCRTETREGIAEYLNSLITTGLSLAPNLGGRTKWERELYSRRKAIEAYLSSALTGGPAVEFSDRFYSIEEICSVWPSDFKGVADLTICNSILLAQAIRARFPHGLLLASEEVTYPEFRLPLYEAVIRLLARRPQPYEDAVYKLRTSLIRRFH